MTPARHPIPIAGADKAATAKVERPRQLYNWPAWLPWACAGVVGLGATGLVAALAVMFSARTADDAGILSVGFLAALFSSLGMVSGALVAFAAVREVRFTFDHLEVRRLGRRTLRLAYSRYDRDWVADCGHTHVVRLLVMRGNTACSIYLPPDWMRDALEEIARIQLEEGWYDPAP